MTVTTRGRRQPQPTSYPRRRQKVIRRSQPSGSIIVPSLKASLVGGFGMLILMLISLIPPLADNLPFVSLAYLVIPGFLVVCLATGLLASILAGDAVQNSQQGGKVGWMAGFLAGVFGGIVAMILAAIGAFMGSFGQGVVNQFTPEQLESLINYGLSPEAIALAGRVFGALIVYGIVGSLISALVSAIGGMIYPKLSN